MMDNLTRIQLTLWANDHPGWEVSVLGIALVLMVALAVWVMWSLLD